jgi:hypothetical protein
MNMRRHDNALENHGRGIAIPNRRAATEARRLPCSLPALPSRINSFEQKAATIQISGQARLRPEKATQLSLKLL